ncbi:MAG: hypothetical protein ACXVDT_16425 [Bacteroidia bacterium]
MKNSIKKTAGMASGTGGSIVLSAPPYYGRERNKVERKSINCFGENLKM